MKKLVFACTLAAAFAFVACKSNKTAEPVVAAEETEVVAEAPASLPSQQGVVQAAGAAASTSGSSAATTGS
ncbi:MAG: hypothetical protein K2O66_03345, partial [Bacteroidales bacterium]|nr:hypothetical protein [Bacteroidales bacterium]